MVANKGFPDGYVRPIAWRGSEQMGVSAQQSKINVAIAIWEWGDYYCDLRPTRSDRTTGRHPTPRRPRPRRPGST